MITLQGQENAQSFRPFYEAYLRGSAPEMLAAFEEAKTEEVSTVEQVAHHYELAKMAMAIAGFCMGTGECDTGPEELIDQSMEWLKAANAHAPSIARYPAMLAGAYGLKMGLDPWKGIYLGPRSGELLDQALALDLACPEAWLQKGHSSYNTPEMFGGSKKEAVQNYEKAVAAFESTGNLEGNWLYLDALAWLGMAYRENERWVDARNTFLKALEREKDFMWVKKGLLPALEKQMGK